MVAEKITTHLPNRTGYAEGFDVIILRSRGVGIQKPHDGPPPSDIILASWQAWIEAGGPVELFWSLTPWQSLAAIQALGNKKEAEARMFMSMAWHEAAFQRSPRMPPLDRVLYPRGRQFENTDDLYAALKAQYKVKRNG